MWVCSMYSLLSAWSVGLLPAMSPCEVAPTFLHSWNERTRAGGEKDGPSVARSARAFDAPSRLMLMDVGVFYVLPSFRVECWSVAGNVAMRGRSHVFA